MPQRMPAEITNRRNIKPTNLIKVVMINALKKFSILKPAELSSFNLLKGDNKVLNKTEIEKYCQTNQTKFINTPTRSLIPLV